MSTKLDFSVFYNVIDGELKSTKTTRHSINPATGDANPEVPVTTQEELDEAVAAARKAQKSWAKTTFQYRRECLEAFADELDKYREEFVRLLVSEQGKASALAQDEFNRSLRMLRQTGTLNLEEELVEDDGAKTATVRYIPIGVGCGLVPWNYPLLLQWGKVAPAVFAGNSIIIKPSPDTPYVGLKSIELAMKFFPPGVIQAISGGHELGPLCTAHPGIDKIAFTGSIPTGKLVMASCAKTLKRVTLELGGNDAAIICEDADFESTVPAIAQLSFINSGQICMSIKRVYVHSAIYDKFLEALVAYSKNLNVGNGNDPTVFVGPLQNATQLENVQSYYDDIVKEGLNPVLGGSNDSFKDSKGFFATPTIISNPPDSARIVQEEPFGPIIPVLKWDGTDEEIVDRVNDFDVGLGASVWSKNIPRAQRMARDLQAGSVWVNMHFNVEATVPFGGVKNSGIGSEWGLVGLKGWCNVQSVWVPK